jgi:hypothetical protein
MTKCEVTINGVPVSNLGLYAIRWVADGERWLPVLYQGGKRVTEAWSIRLSSEEAHDPYGGNANTA